MVFQSVERLVTPQPIQYREAIVIAAAGLAVNLVCAWWLRDSQTHAHSHGHDHATTHAHDHAAQEESGQMHADLNVRAAYVHVLADAATSVLAMVALAGGLLWGLEWLDPLMGLVGAALISIWAVGLLRDSGRVLLDAEMDAPVVAEIRDVVERGDVPARITDLHVWRVGRSRYAVVLTVATDSDKDGEYFRRALSVHEELAHVTVEITPGARRRSDATTDHQPPA
jgi:cation diffusion facilitator family transporter